jgi:hypothetical protein
MAVAAATLLIAAPSPATAASPTKGATYEYGHAFENTVSLQVSRRGGAFTYAEIVLFYECSNGREGLESFIWSRRPGPAQVPIGRDGSFSAMLTSTQVENLNPFLVSEEYWLSGRFTRRGKAARLVVRGRLVGEGGTVCDTGDLRVTARRVPQGRTGP